MYAVVLLGLAVPLTVAAVRRWGTSSILGAAGAVALVLVWTLSHTGASRRDVHGGTSWRGRPNSVWS